MINEWRERVHDKRCVAVGDVGLDGNGSGRQRVVFGALLTLDTGKPMVSLCRGYLISYGMCGVTGIYFRYESQNYVTWVWGSGNGLVEVV